MLAQELAEKYTGIVLEFFQIMEESESVQASDMQPFLLQLGLNAITHIFKMSFYASKHVATTVAHTQKGAYCFIEYIEQTHKLGVLSSSIDYMDAVAFIYDKSLSDICLGQGNYSSSSYNNILSNTHYLPEEDSGPVKTLFTALLNATSTFCWITNPSLTLSIRRDIMAQLHTFLQIIAHNREEEPFAEVVCMFLTTMQEKIGLVSPAQYVDLLTSINKEIKRKQKKKESIHISTVRDFCLYLIATHNGALLDDVVVEEGFKKGTEDLVKTAFRGF